MEKTCRKVNGKVVCEETNSGGLFGGSPTVVQPRPTQQRTASRPPQTYPQAYSHPVEVKTQPRVVAGSYQIPPKDIIENSQFGNVESLKCKKDKKTGKLRCRVITE